VTDAIALPVVSLRVIAPAALLAVTGFVLMLLDLLPPRHRRDHMAIVGLTGVSAVLVSVFLLWGSEASGFQGMVVLDNFALFMTLVIGFATGLVLFLSVDYLRRLGMESGEFYILVLFAATDIELVHGPPAQRRRFLDILISQVDRAYLRTLQRYQRVVTQRNHLLRLIRDGRGSPDDLDFWDSELVKEGSTLVARRSQIVQQLAPLATRAYRGLAVEEEMSVVYLPSVAADALAGALASQRAVEIKAV